MAKWKYTLAKGAKLREAIEDGDNLQILNALEECYREINKAMPEDYEEDELQSDLDEIENQRDNLENYEDYEMTLQDCEDEIDYMLGNFYNLCDALRIWVSGV